MRLRVYSMFDIVAMAYVGGLSLFGHDAAAVRAFGDALSDRQNPMSRHPKDFDLHCVGEFDDANGSLNGVGTVVDDHGDTAFCIITGAAWFAAQARSAPELPLDDTPFAMTGRPEELGEMRMPPRATRVMP